MCTEMIGFRRLGHMMWYVCTSRQLYDDRLLTVVGGIDRRFSVTVGGLAAIDDDDDNDGETTSLVAWIQTR